MRAENSPCMERTAARAAAAVPASIRSAMASACAMSILPFKKARSLNSPGRAMRQPSSSRRFNTISSTEHAAMALQLQDVFAGVGSGRGKIQGQSPIERLALRVEEIRETCATRGGGSAPRIAGRDLRHARTRDADHPDRAAPGSAGDGDDGVGLRLTERLRIAAWRPRLRPLG